MGTERNKFNRFIPACLTIMTKNDYLIFFPAANEAVQINNDEILFHRTTVITSEISLQRLSHPHRICHDHIHFFLNGTLQSSMLLYGIRKSIAESDVH